MLVVCAAICAISVSVVPKATSGPCIAVKTAAMLSPTSFNQEALAFLGIRFANSLTPSARSLSVLPKSLTLFIPVAIFVLPAGEPSSPTNPVIMFPSKPLFLWFS